MVVWQAAAVLAAIASAELSAGWDHARISLHMRQEQSNERQLNKAGQAVVAPAQLPVWARLVSGIRHGAVDVAGTFLNSATAAQVVWHGLMHAKWQVADLLSRPAPPENGAGPVAELAPVLYVSGEESVEQVSPFRMMRLQAASTGQRTQCWQLHGASTLISVLSKPGPATSCSHPCQWGNIPLLLLLPLAF